MAVMLVLDDLRAAGRQAGRASAWRVAPIPRSPPLREATAASCTIRPPLAAARRRRCLFRGAGGWCRRRCRWSAAPAVRRRRNRHRAVAGRRLPTGEAGCRRRRDAGRDRGRRVSEQAGSLAGVGRRCCRGRAALSASWRGPRRVGPAPAGGDSCKAAVICGGRGTSGAASPWPRQRSSRRGRRPGRHRVGRRSACCCACSARGSGPPAAASRFRMPAGIGCQALVGADHLHAAGIFRPHPDRSDYPPRSPEPSCCAGWRVPARHRPPASQCR